MAATAGVGLETINGQFVSFALLSPEEYEWVIGLLV